MIETGDIQVIIEDGTNANLCQQIAYIKAGKTEIEEAVQEGIGDFNTNATEKTNTFNSNASAKTLAFNQNADAKTLIYDNNASNKLTAYNENATNKLADFNTNATNKTTAFDLNATSKTNDFNSNAGSKTDAFNDNYLDKKALIDAEVQVAKDWATKTDGTVDGVDYSAKYYAQSILPIKDDITAVAEIATDVSDVAEIKDEVTAVAQDKENVDAVAENITNVNTVAGDHANIQTVVNNMTAINNAPTYANNSKIWAEGLDGEVAPLGGTHSSKGWAQIAEAAASGVQNPANRDLSNLTNTGQMVIDSANGTISNCILEIPQNLKLTLESNVLTLKSGSILTKTGSTYVTLTTTTDKTYTVSSTQSAGKYVVLCQQGNGTIDSIVKVNDIHSGTTAQRPAFEDVSIGYKYFNTDTKQWNLRGNSAWNENWGICYPLCIIDVIDGVASFAKDSNGNDMIFNGAGFIGDAIFTYPGIKGLIPNGFNADGSLRSTEFTTNSLTIITSLGSYNFHRYVVTNGGTWVVSPTLNYIKEVNRNSTGSGYWNFVAAIEFDLDVNASPKITNFTIRQPVRLATTEMLDKVQDQVDTKQETLVSGTNIKTINSTTVLGSGNFTLADQSLSNLDSTGQMVVDSQNGTISNCILEIPQNLKLTLENNVLTAKSGSTVVNTGETYSTLTTTADATLSIVVGNLNYNPYYVMCYGNMNLQLIRMAGVYSGSLLPENLPSNNDLFYLTTDKSIYQWKENTQTFNKTAYRYPLGIVQRTSSTAVTFAKDSKGHDLIFNGAGFIGHHIFVYPNVKALVPDGFNENGSLKSTNATTLALNILEMRNPSYEIEYTFPVSISYMYTVARNAYRIINKFDDLIKQIGVIQFLKKSNVCYIYDDVADKFKEQNWTPFVAYNYDGTTVTQFDIQQPYEGARNLLTDDIEEQIGDIETALTTIIGA